MYEDKSPIEPAVVETFETTDADEFSAANAPWDVEYSQLRPGRLTLRLQAIDLGSCLLQREQWCGSLRLRGAPLTGTVGVSIMPWCFIVECESPQFECAIISREQPARGALDRIIESHVTGKGT